jgi:hypothetical protein
MLGEHISPVSRVVPAATTMYTRFFARTYGLYRECDGGVADFQDAIDLVLIEPPARDAGADVRFVLVIGIDYLDRHTSIGRAKFLNGLLDTDESGRPTTTGERSRLVAQNA